MPVLTQGKDALVRATVKLGGSATKGESASREGQAGGVVSRLALVFDVFLLDAEPPGLGGHQSPPSQNWLRPMGRASSHMDNLFHGGGGPIQRGSSSSKFLHCLRSPSLIEPRVHHSLGPMKQRLLG